MEKSQQKFVGIIFYLAGEAFEISGQSLRQMSEFFRAFFSQSLFSRRAKQGSKTMLLVNHAFAWVAQSFPSFSLFFFGGGGGSKEQSPCFFFAGPNFIHPHPPPTPKNTLLGVGGV